MFSSDDLLKNCLKIVLFDAPFVVPMLIFFYYIINSKTITKKGLVALARFVALVFFFAGCLIVVFGTPFNEKIMQGMGFRLFIGAFFLGLFSKQKRQC